MKNKPAKQYIVWRKAIENSNEAKWRNNGRVATENENNQ